MTEKDILHLMSELRALQRGHFLLSSGLHSDTYFQCARLLQFPELARELGQQIARQVSDRERIDVVVSPALGGILIGHEVARALGRRFIFTERAAGEMRLRRGFQLEKGEKVLIVEDVVTRGTSLREVVEVVQGLEGAVLGLAAIVDRTAGAVELPWPLSALARVEVATFEPSHCPLCAEGTPVVKPGSRGN
jgi:orotate phosphoribosyltransferase